ncbi:MAG: HAD family hydrolase [Prolixibacteraceae bacterium]|nr:HAD family hydrolase [Prolixibacteraceae bacterium]
MQHISKFENVTTIIWDWNGTLFDDTDICIHSINKLLAERELEHIDRQRYLEVFDFPVRDYYQRIGFDFDKEPFEIPAQKFIENYFTVVKQAKLHAGATRVLNHFQNAGLKQVVLSAAEQNKLLDLLSYFGISSFFEQVRGLDHDYATSKVELGQKMLANMAVEPENACLIGDTLHDYEVACSLRCKCILIANGHHPAEKLKTSGVPVLSKIDELCNFVIPA